MMACIFFPVPLDKLAFQGLKKEKKKVTSILKKEELRTESKACHQRDIKEGRISELPEGKASLERHNVLMGDIYHLFSN